MKTDRRKMLVEAVNREGQLDFSRLKDLFPDVSDMTLRSDLRALDQEGLIIRVHGGAKSIENAVRADDLFFKKATRNVAQKRQIAMKAISLIRPGMSVFIDCGTTIQEFVKMLPDEQYFIVTNSVSGMQELSKLTKAEVLLLGGKLNRFNLSTFDPRNQFDIEKRNFDVAFMAVTGYSSEHGFSCGTEVDDDLRKTAIRRADRVVMLMDSSKVGRMYPVTYAHEEDVDILISDGELDEKTAEVFRQKGVEVL